MLNPEELGAAPDLALANDPSRSLFQRVLLITDGTLTHLLEAYAREPMRVTKLSQCPMPSDGAAPALELPPHESALRRTVLLRGQASGTTFLYAESVIAPERLEPAVREGLVLTDEPIGVLLARARIETLRDILRWGTEPAGERACHFGIERAAALIFRTYRVLAGGRPIMVITEMFPASWFLSEPEPNGASGARRRP